MNKDVENKLKNLLSGINPSMLKGGSIDKIINSPQGKKIAEGLSAEEKQKLISAFMGLSNEEINKKLNNAKMADLSGLSAEEILKKLK